MHTLIEHARRHILPRHGNGNADPHTCGMTEFGDRLAEARAAAGLTQEQLAEQAGVAQETISRIVTGDTAEPKATTWRKLASVFGLTGDELLQGMPPRQEYSPQARRMVARGAAAALPATTIDRTDAPAAPLEDDETPLERAIVHAWSTATARDPNAYTKAMREDAIAASRDVARLARDGVDLNETARYYLNAARAAHRRGLQARTSATVGTIAAEVTSRLLPMGRAAIDQLTRDANTEAAAMADAWNNPPVKK